MAQLYTAALSCPGKTARVPGSARARVRFPGAARNGEYVYDTCASESGRSKTREVFVATDPPSTGLGKGSVVSFCHFVLFFLPP